MLRGGNSAAFCEWEDEPNHLTLLAEPKYKIFAGRLPPHDETLVHAHRHPTVCISLLSARDVKNIVCSSDGQRLEGSDWPRGALFQQLQDPHQPLVHYVQTGQDPVSFVCAEIYANIRRTGDPAPSVMEMAAPGVSTLPVLTESSFSSGVHVNLQPGAAVEMRSRQTNADIILLRVVFWVGGPDLRQIHVRLPGELTVRYLNCKSFDPLVQVAVIDGFAQTNALETVFGLHNLGEEVSEIAVVDVFETQ